MINNFTSHDIVKLVYSELNQEDSRQLLRIINNDPLARKEYNGMKAMKKQLDDLERKPSKSCTNNILQFAKMMNLHDKKESMN